MTTSPDRYVLELPPLPFYSANSRMHWSEKASLVAEWRRAAFFMAKKAKVPHLDEGTVGLDYWPADRRRRDPDNLVPGVFKPVVDGLVDAGVFDDDTPDIVTRLMPVIHLPLEDRSVVWHCTIIPGAPT